MSKIALITGITGQDGSYLADLLLEKSEYDLIVGLHRRSSTVNTSRVHHILHHPKFILEEFDLTDPISVAAIIEKYNPNEFYNLAAQSHVGTSFKQPTTTFNINTNGVVNILDSIVKHSPGTKLYQASTSEMFGANFSVDVNTGEKYQDENTSFKPQSPYGVAKLAAHNLVRIYREGYDIFGCCGILFNHESPRRGENFVTRKITKWIGEFVNSGRSENFPKLRLGNLEARRDWGHAKDYVRAMWMMLQQDTPDDFVICTERTHSISDFLNASFNLIDINDWDDYVVQDPEFYRPAEVDYLKGRSSKAFEKLGWKPELSFEALVANMVEYDTNKKQCRKNCNEKLSFARI
jgi:GDPmannose 4,6-dehydratase